MKIIFPVVMIMLVLLVLCSFMFGIFGYNVGVDKGKAMATPIVNTKVVHDVVHDSPTIVQQSSGNYNQGVADGTGQVRDNIWTYFQTQCSSDVNGAYRTTLSRDADGTLHFHCLP